jgi:hypothetical protein
MTLLAAINCLNKIIRLSILRGMSSVDLLIFPTLLGQDARIHYKIILYTGLGSGHEFTKI